MKNIKEMTDQEFEDAVHELFIFINKVTSDLDKLFDEPLADLLPMDRPFGHMMDRLIRKRALVVSTMKWDPEKLKNLNPLWVKCWAMATGGLDTKWKYIDIGDHHHELEWLTVRYSDPEGNGELLYKYKRNQ